MYSFKNDYSEGAHPGILEALANNNLDQEDGYGLDKHSLAVADIIRHEVGDVDGGVHLLSGGTQTNLIAISAFLRPHEACIAATSGHITTHETGAVEATGHKIVTVEGQDGKLHPDLIKPVLEGHYFEHMVKPRLVYISNTTEFGTVYSLDELRELSEFCRSNDLFLYLDGARLGAALACKESKLTLRQVYELTDAFFIGGTKNGALLGEALVVRNLEVNRDLRYYLKQRGALLAKGRVVGIQFEALLKDNLYLELAGHANAMAQLLAEKLAAEGVTFLINSPTNQIFPILNDQLIKKLSEQFGFYVWSKVNEQYSAVRLVTSWATKREHVDDFIRFYQSCRQ